jgi:hypothetical protein
MSREEKISARARRLFAKREKLEKQIREIDAELIKARAEYRVETKVFVNDMVRFRNAVHQIKVAA